MIPKRRIRLSCRCIITVFFCVLLFAVCMPVYAKGSLELQANVQDMKNVVLQWESESETDCFQIYKSKDGGKSYSLLATLSGQRGTVFCYDQEVALGKTYGYKIVEISENVIVKESEPVMVKVALPPPSGLRTKVIKQSRVLVTWNKVKKANYYTVYRSTKKDSGYTKLTTVKENSYTDYQVSRGTTYYYRIVACNKKNKKWQSDKCEAVYAHLKLSAPKLVSTYENNKIKLTWSKVSGADSYYIYKQNSKGKYQLLGKTAKLYYRDDRVVSGESYQYKILATVTVNGKVMKGESSKPYKVWATTINPSKKMVALTYDDGPSSYTEDIVKCLKDNNAKATFFVLGCNIDAHKQAVQKAYKSGCEIGNHTYSHPMLSFRSNEEIRNEIASTDKKIKKITGKNATVMRPPGGDVNERVATVVNKPVILWSIDTRDWEHRNSSKTVQSVIGNVRDGDVVLMHDIYKPTRDASLTIIPQLRRMGYQLVTVSELAEYRGASLKKGRIYHSFRKSNK